MKKILKKLRKFLQSDRPMTSTANTQPSLNTSKKDEYVESLKKSLTLDKTHFLQITEKFTNEIEKGLKTWERGTALPSYITGLPTGQEKGIYLALDLGGTNLRVCLVILQGNGKYELLQKKEIVSDDVKSTSGESFFDHIADFTQAFLNENEQILKNNHVAMPLKLGFTFSFPLKQEDVNNGTIIGWTKGFSVAETIGKDAVRLLQDSFDRKQVPVKCVVILNDTVGTLLSAAYEYPNTVIGVIFGSGTNAATFEQIEQIVKLDDQKKESLKSASSDQMIVNLEWGAFDSEAETLPLTSYDRKLDQESNNPGKQVYEKMISGVYCGDILRRILLDLSENKFLLQGQDLQQLRTSILDTKFISHILGDSSADLVEVSNVLKEFNITSSSLEDRKLIKELTDLVAKRSALLGSIGIATILKRHPQFVEKGCTVGIDGSLYEHIPGYRDNLFFGVGEILGKDVHEKVNIVLTKDGSGVGAALAAMIVSGRD